jgi:hypothetical protein
MAKGLRNAIYNDAPNTGLESIQSDARIAVKNSIADMVLSMRVGPEKFSSEFFNVMVTGSAGTGKTTVARVMGYVLSQIKFMFFSEVAELTPSDLRGEFKGETLQKTKVKLLENLEHVVFLDEAYIMAGCDAQGNKQKDNSDGQELIGELLTFTNDQKGNTVIVVAGYEKPMLGCFLTVNEGTPRRFPETSRISLQNYSGTDLANILRGNIQRSSRRSKKNKYLYTAVFSEDAEWRVITKTVKLMNDARKPSVFNGQAGDMDNLATLLLKRADQEYLYFREGFDRELYAAQPNITKEDTVFKRFSVVVEALQEYAKSKELNLTLVVEKGILQPKIT